MHIFATEGFVKLRNVRSNIQTERKMSYRFTLEPYKGVSTRHTCPNCHRKSCFAKYIDTEKQISFPDYVRAMQP